MIRSRTTRQFWKHFSALPGSVQKAAVRSYRLFSQDPHHPSLRFKRVEGLSDVYSVRITADYRALGVMGQGEITWYWIGDHGEYIRELNS